MLRTAAAGSPEARSMTHQWWRVRRGHGSQGTYSEQGYPRLLYPTKGYRAPPPPAGACTKSQNHQGESAGITEHLGSGVREGDTALSDKPKQHLLWWLKWN